MKMKEIINGKIINTYQSIIIQEYRILHDKYRSKKTTNYRATVNAIQNRLSTVCYCTEKDGKKEAKEQEQQKEKRKGYGMYVYLCQSVYLYTRYK